MAEMIEVLEDGVENTKKLFKKKPFLIAAVGVGAVALYVAYKKSQETTGEMGYAVGYSGYPTVGGSSSGSSDEAYFDQILSENQSQYSDLMNSVISEYDSAFSELQSTIGVLSDRVTTSEARNEEYEKQIIRQTAISQMLANSELYNTVSDRATKDALHAENLAIAEEMGWTFNAEDGHYYENGKKVYTTSAAKTGQNTAYTGGTSSTTKTGTSSSSSSFVNNSTYNSSVIDSILKASQSDPDGYVDDVDYSALYNEAAQNGASTATLKAIQAARQNKVNDVYGGVDPNPSSSVAKANYQQDGKNYTTASDGKPIEVTKTASGSGMKTSSSGVSMARDTSRAGQTITANGFQITYDENGYAVSSKNLAYTG